jgi:CDP-diglyceride synthetase
MTASADGMSGGPGSGRRVLLLGGLFFLTLPGWVIGIYLILKWTGLVRGMSRVNEVAVGWAIAIFSVVILALALVSVLTLAPGASSADAGAAQGPLWIVVAAVASMGAFYVVKTNGAPQITRNPDWGGFALGAIVTVVAVGFSLSSYERAAGGGMYVLAWGPALWGVYKALKSLRRPDGAALPQQPMLEELRRRQPVHSGAQPEPGGTGQAQSTSHSLAVGMLVLAAQVALTDGTIDNAEAAAIGQGFATIHSATKSGPVEQAAGLVVADLAEIMDWIQSPVTGPLDLMLANAGQVLRQLGATDQRRYIGQAAWLCETIAAASGGASGAELEWMDSGLATMGFSPPEVAEALTFCDQNGG